MLFSQARTWETDGTVFRLTHCPGGPLLADVLELLLFSSLLQRGAFMLLFFQWFRRFCGETATFVKIFLFFFRYCAITIAGVFPKKFPAGGVFFIFEI